MVKQILKITLAACMLMSVPATIHAANAIEIIDNEIVDVDITLNGNTLHVANATGQMLFIYNVAGVRVMSVKVESADKHYELNLPKGCYIVKVGKTVRKISIK